MSERPPTSLAVASTAGYGWGAVMLLVSIAVAIPAVADGRPVVNLALPLALSVASLAGAHGVWHRRRPFVAVGASAAWIAFLVMVPLKLSLAGVALNVVILGLVLTNVRRFR